MATDLPSEPPTSISKSAPVQRYWIVAVATPVITFVLGILAQQAFQDWLDKHDVVKLGLFMVAAASGSLAVLVALLASWYRRDLHVLETTLNSQTVQVTEALRRLDISSGLVASYVDDSGEGHSYLRAAEIIGSATESITFVDLWEPFADYQSKNGTQLSAEDTTSAREAYYDSIRNVLCDNLSSDHLFHRRIVQVPHKLLGEKIPFSIDPPVQ